MSPKSRLPRRLLLLASACLVAAAASVVPAPAGAAGRCGDPATRPWCDTSRSPDDRAQLLLAALTPQERIDLLGGDEITGVAGGEGKHTGTQNGVPRLGVPTIYYTDGPLGPRQGKITGMPSPVADAATWSPAMNRAYGRVAGEEARSKGDDVIYGPTVNLMRTPLGGRTYEGFGEDPFLVAQTAVAWIEGVQSTGVLADVKHFALNNQEGRSLCCADLQRPGQPGQGAITPPDIEGGRMNVNVHVDERTLREMELAPFEAAVRQANVASIMCSYNLVGGTYACQNDHLLLDILKQWHYRNFVLSDYAAAHDTGRSLKSGLDFEPWPGFDVYGPVPVIAALATGQATQADVDRHVLRMLRTFFAFGVFDRPAFKDDTASIPQVAHRQVSQRIEEQAITLLLNRHHTLPLRADKLKSIAVIGAGASTFVTGGGSGNVTPFRYVSPQQAITARVSPGTKVLVDDGSNSARAAQVARSAQVAVVFTPDFGTESVDRRCITLECPPAFGDQDGLIRAVAAANKRTIVVLETGGPDLTPWRGQVAGLLEAWYPGQEGGTAIARVLFGDTDPGGRLPVTFPNSEADLPTAGDSQKYPGTGNQGNQEYYKEGVFLGYRWFDAHSLKPAFSFGYGLSYTSFTLSGLKITPNRSAPGATVSLSVKNTGSRTGYAVPQLYVGLPQPSPSIAEPPAQLVGFQKLQLAPGKSRHVRLTIDSRHLSYWDTAGQSWRVSSGCVTVMVGTSSRDLPLHGVLADGGAKCPTAPPRPRAGCPAPTGRLSGRTLGPITLGETRARVRHGLRRSNGRRAPYTDVFCFHPIGIRVGFPPPPAATRLTSKLRKAIAGRVVLIITASRHYALHGIRPGATLASAERKLRLGRAIQTGVNTWFLAPMRGVTGVLKTRRGVVEEVGIADPRFTMPRALAIRFLASF